MWEKPETVIMRVDDTVFISDGYRKVLEAYSTFQNDPTPDNEVALEHAREELRREMGYIS